MTRLAGNLYRGFGPLTGGSSAPATPTLSVADNGDGTGAVAAISGSTPGSTNTVYTAPWGVAGQNLSFTANGPRTSDGTLPLSLANGFYAGYCESVLAALPSYPSNQVLFQVTGGVSYASQHAALAAAVQSIIQSMLGTSIIGPTSSSVRVRKTGYMGDYSAISPLPANYQYALPGIVVCFFDVEEIDPLAGTSARDAIGYPITIVFAQETKSANTPSETNIDPFLAWRQAIRKKFQHLRGVTPSGFLSVTAGGVTYKFHNCIFKGGMIVDPDRSINKRIDVGWMKFSFVLWDGS